MNENIDKPTMKLPPLKRICMTIGQLPSSYVESMSYYEMLVWFIHYLRDEVIPVVNANGEAVEELQQLYVQLQDYVNNYFDNLDVQEEINNKLDKMVEDGTLSSLLNQYANLIKVYANYEEFSQDDSLVNGNKIRILSYDDLNDGIIDCIITNIQDETKCQISLNEGLYATIINEEINIKYLGAIKDNDISSILNNSIPFFKKINITDTYTIEDHVIASTPIELNFKNTISNSTGTIAYISLLNDSKINGLSSYNVGVDVYGSNNIIENCSVSNSTKSPYYINCGNSVVHRNNKFINCISNLTAGMGFQIARNTNISSRSESITGAIVDDLVYENCKASHSGTTENAVTGTWSTGFCIENAGAINKKIMYINCEAEYSAESGFHTEYNTIPENLIYINCNSHDNGTIKVSPTYGAGFLAPQEATYVNCISHNNYKLYQCVNIDMISPIDKLNKMDIKDYDSENHTELRVSSIFANSFYNKVWDGKNIIFTTTPLTNTTTSPKLRPEFYLTKLNQIRTEDYVTITGNEISFLETDKQKHPLTLNIMEVDPTMKINYTFKAKAKVHTDGTNNNCQTFLMGYDEHFVAKGIISSKSLNGIDTDEYITISNTNINITNQDIKYAVLVIMPNYSNVYTYQAPYVKDIVVYQTS